MASGVRWCLEAARAGVGIPALEHPVVFKTLFGESRLQFQFPALVQGNA